MKRYRISAFVNWGIILAALTNFFLLAMLMDQSEPIEDSGELTNSYQEVFPNQVFTEGHSGRSANFLRVDADKSNGWMRLAYANCTPSANPRVGFISSDMGLTPGFSTPIALRDASLAFEGCPYIRLMEVGAQGKDYLKNLFLSGEFRLIVRWRLPANSTTLPAFVLVKEKDQEGKVQERYLHEILIERGFAYPVEMSIPGPYGESAKELYERAQAAHERAREARVGAFQHELDNEFFEAPDTRQAELFERALGTSTPFNDLLPEKLAQENREELGQRLSDRVEDLERAMQTLNELKSQMDGQTNTEFLRKAVEEQEEIISIIENKIEEIRQEQELRDSVQQKEESTSAAPTDERNPSQASPEPDPTSLLSFPQN